MPIESPANDLTNMPIELPVNSGNMPGGHGEQAMTLTGLNVYDIATDT